MAAAGLSVDPVTVTTWWFSQPWSHHITLLCCISTSLSSRTPATFITCWLNPHKNPDPSVFLFRGVGESGQPFSPQKGVKKISMPACILQVGGGEVLDGTQPARYMGRPMSVWSTKILFWTTWRTRYTSVLTIFSWFDWVAPSLKVTKCWATETMSDWKKSPVGRKHVNTCFLVKMWFKIESFGSI